MVRVLLWLNYLWHFPCRKARKQLGGRCDNLTVIYDNTMLRVRQTAFRGLTEVGLLLFLPLRKENVRSKLSNCSFFFCLCQEWELRTDALKQTAACSQLTASCGFSPISAKYERTLTVCLQVWTLSANHARSTFYWLLSNAFFFISNADFWMHYSCWSRQPLVSTDVWMVLADLCHRKRQFTCGLIRRVCSRPVD